MKRRHALAVTAASALTASFALVFSASAASADPLELKADDARADLIGNVDPALVREMSETFGLSASEVHDRLAVEAVASDLLEQVPEDFTDSYAGLWVSEDADEILVATTSAADADELAAEGATPVLVDYDMSELEAAIDALATAAGTDIYGYYIDVEANRVVIEAANDAAAAELVEVAGVETDMIAVDTEVKAPDLHFVRGGDRYTMDNGFVCSVGFAVRQGSTPGFVTAGHCGDTGTRLNGGNAAPGVFRNSIFPGNDAAWVSVDAGTQLTNTVNMYSGTRTVSNSNQAAVGSSICRSGQTTGWHCGTVQAFNQTVNYEEGTVRGLTRTSACSQKGDSGGSFIAGNSAQGVLSGGSGNCSTGGTSFFQPINPMLNSWNLTLVTS